MKLIGNWKSNRDFFKIKQKQNWHSIKYCIVFGCVKFEIANVLCAKIHKMKPKKLLVFERCIMNEFNKVYSSEIFLKISMAIENGL